MNSRNFGLPLAFGAPLVYSIMNVGMRFQLDSTLTVWGLLCVRGLVGLLFLGLAAKMFKKKLGGKNRPRLLLVGLTSFLSTICLVLAIANIPLYQALVLLYLFPALTVPLDFFLNGARVGRRTVFW
ncbi:MAG: EamA family transporter, partial [Candidatus Adiutrix sp.]|nr:EamA family transporter [Candidatus Adiutrix sp.]